MLVLASSSSARRAMLEAAGVGFEVAAAALDEAECRHRWRGLAGDEVALRLAAAKAEMVSLGRPGALVLGSDSLIELAPGQVLEKPGTPAGLRAQLLQLRGRSHRLLSAAALVRDGELLWRHLGEARLFVRNFSNSFLDHYVEREGAQVLQSVGGYHVEGPGAQLFERIEGSEFVIRGLPLLAVLAALRDFGEMPA